MKNLYSKQKQAEIRAKIKLELLQEQHICPLCGEPLFPIRGGGIHMHEWLLKRGRVPNEIWTKKWNCVLLHGDCHLSDGQTKLATRKCYLVKYTVDLIDDIYSLYEDGIIKVLPDMGFLYMKDFSEVFDTHYIGKLNWVELSPDILSTMVNKDMGVIIVPPNHEYAVAHCYTAVSIKNGGARQTLGYTPRVTNKFLLNIETIIVGNDEIIDSGCDPNDELLDKINSKHWSV